MAIARKDLDPGDEREVPVTEARARISDLVGRAEHGGARTVLTRHGRPAAAVVPVADLERLRVLDEQERRARADADTRRVSVSFSTTHDPATVWDTLLEPTWLRRWWPGAVLVDEVGVPVGGVEPAGAEVAEVVEPCRLVLRWTDPGVATPSSVGVELTAADGGTTVVLTHRGLADDELAAAHRGAWEQRLAAWRAVLGT